MADWQAIKTEYITTDTSYRKLAQKYGVTHTNIGIRSRKEGWAKLREQHNDKTTTKAVNAIGTKQANMAAKLYEAGGMLLDTVKRMIEENPEMLAETSSMKDVSVVLKNLKDLMSVKSEADMLEQEARIAKLRKEAERDDVSHAPTLVVEGLPEEFKV